MNQSRTPKLFTTLILLFFLQISGCANTDSGSTNRKPEQANMGRKGQGMHQGPPPGERDTKDTEQENTVIPVEAFAACEKKQSGDVITFIDSRGETITATCQDYDDHLVAIPDKRKAKDGHH